MPAPSKPALRYTVLDSPVGELTVAGDGQVVTELHIAGDRYFAAVPQDWVYDPADSLLQEAARQLQDYFAGRRREFDLPLRPQGTAFQQGVWDKLRQIPPGSTSSYGEIAQALGRPGAARAVGTAIGRNPICILIPCHRVTAAGGGLGGFVAGTACKQHLLGVER